MALTAVSMGGLGILNPLPMKKLMMVFVFPYKDVCMCVWVCMHLQCMSVCVCRCVCMCALSWECSSGHQFPEAGDKSVCEPPDMGTGNGTQVLWKISTYF